MLSEATTVHVYGVFYRNRGQWLCVVRGDRPHSLGKNWTIQIGERTGWRDSLLGSLVTPHCREPPRGFCRALSSDTISSGRRGGGGSHVMYSEIRTPAGSCRVRSKFVSACETTPTGTALSDSFLGQHHRLANGWSSTQAARAAWKPDTLVFLKHWNVSKGVVSQMFWNPLLQFN